MNDQSSAQGSRVYILYGVLIALLTVSIVLVIVAGTRDSNTNLLPTPTPTTLPTPGITPITQEMLNQQFLPADHVVTINDAGVDKTQINARLGQMLQFTNSTTSNTTIKVGVDNQNVSPGSSYSLSLSTVGQQSFTIEVAGKTYTLTVTIE